MAKDTPLSYRNLVIYEIYVRNHGPNGTFADVEADLPRIRSMGVDIVWFMPIHPIGQLNKKGSLGCPYSIQDYRGINPEYGTRQDFAHLIETAHALGLKVMIDVVYNHTSHDSILVKEHPEYFHQDEHGRPYTTVPEWTDVIDLKHPNPGLTEYLIETLKGWAAFGVDGFRCDVAPLLPQEFWELARAEVANVKPGVIWLSETVHASWIGSRRFQGLTGLSDSEIYTAFDMTYDYDIWAVFQQAVHGKKTVQLYLEMLRLQDCIYPANFIKMRCAENHDNLRIQTLAPGRAAALGWTAFAAFNRGSFLIYGGQESAAVHTPSLFDIDKVHWGSYELQPFLTTLARLKKAPALVDGRFLTLASEPAIQAAWEHPEAGLYGVFNVRGAREQAQVQLPDGVYPDLLNGGTVEVRSGKLTLPEAACILQAGKLSGLNPLACELLEYHFSVD